MTSLLFWRARSFRSTPPRKCCQGNNKGSTLKLLPFSKFLYIFRKSHQIWLNYLSPSLSYGQKTSRVVPNTPPGRIGLRSHYQRTIHDSFLNMLTSAFITVFDILISPIEHFENKISLRFSKTRSLLECSSSASNSHGPGNLVSRLKLCAFDILPADMFVEHWNEALQARSCFHTAQIP